MTGEYKVAAPNLPEDIALRLFVAWVVRLATEELSLTQYGSGGTGSSITFNFGIPTDRYFSLTADGLNLSIRELENLDVSLVDELLRKAVERTAVEDFGSIQVYEVDMNVNTFDLVDGFPHFARILGDQVHIEGSRRLSDIAVLDFGSAGATTPEQQFFAPAASVKVTIYVPSPAPSDLSGRAASGIAETVAAICALATGRPVDFTAPMFPLTDSSAIVASNDNRFDNSILGLARDGVSLDIFGDLGQLGGTDATLRLRGSLLAYHAALRQSSPDVAVMLFVTAIEALIAPRADWGKTKVTQRFIKTLVELCPTAVDDLVAHPNVEQAFGWKRAGGLPRQRRELLDVVYASRSAPTHSGLNLSGARIMSALGDMAGIRVALLSDLARGALLAFLQAPRSSIIGHPYFDPPQPSKVQCSTKEG